MDGLRQGNGQVRAGRCKSARMADGAADAQRRKDGARLARELKPSRSMEWLNLHASVLNSEALLSSEPLDRATWLFLLAYCAAQENGGTIREAGAWKDRKWQQLARVTLDEVKRESPLWKWEGEHLRVMFYPLEHEKRTKRLRKQSKGAATARWSRETPPVDGGGI